MFNSKLIDGPAPALGNVDEEQAQGVAIRVQSMGAHAADLGQVV